MASSKHLVAVGEPRQASGDTPSASAIYRHAGSKDALPKLEVNTLYELFTRSVEKYPDNQCLGTRERNADGTAGAYKFMTYKEASKMIFFIV